MRYVYFVSYIFTHEQKGSGSGSAEMKMKEPITKVDHIRDIEKWLDRDSGFNGTTSHCQVMNYILLRTEDENET